jgi:hypothetical protein
MTVNGPITAGKDFNFYRKVVVTSSSYNSDCDVNIAIKGMKGFILCTYGAGTVEFNFNGSTTTHGELKPSSPTEKLQFDNRRVDKIWFKLTSGVSATILVFAWA